jgi:hypothetical protein
MSEKICPKCHSALRENANFCSKCRTDVSYMWKAEPIASTKKAEHCPHCGSVLREGAVFCSKCGTTVEKNTDNIKADLSALRSSEPVREIRQNIPNTSEFQEMVFDVEPQELAENVFSKGNVLKQYINGFKNPRAIISGIIIAAIWGILGYINRNGKNNTVTDIISFITFAKGGTYGNLRQVTGGVCGKMITAAGLCSIFNGGLSAAARGMKGIFSKSRMNTGAFICGLGLGALLCLFFIGGKGLNGIAVSISGMMLSMGMLGDRRPSGTNGNLRGMLAGIGSGFAVSGALASLRTGLFPWAYVICGGVALLGLVIMPFTKGKAGVGK